MQSEVADFITIYRNKYELKFPQLSEAYSEPSLSNLHNEIDAIK